jgi:hypothetical protein
MTGLALRRVAPLRPLPGWRIAIAVLLLGASLAGAAVLYSHRQHYVPWGAPDPCGNPRMPRSLVEQCAKRGKLETREWAGPTAFVIVFLGLAGAASVLVTTGRRT